MKERDEVEELAERIARRVWLKVRRYMKRRDEELQDIEDQEEE